MSKFRFTLIYTNMHIVLLHNAVVFICSPNFINNTFWLDFQKFYSKKNFYHFSTTLVCALFCRQAASGGMHKHKEVPLSLANAEDRQLSLHMSHMRICMYVCLFVRVCVYQGCISTP